MTSARPRLVLAAEIDDAEVFVELDLCHFAIFQFRTADYPNAQASLGVPRNVVGSFARQLRRLVLFGEFHDGLAEIPGRRSQSSSWLEETFGSIKRDGVFCGLQ